MLRSRFAMSFLDGRPLLAGSLRIRGINIGTGRTGSLPGRGRINTCPFAPELAFASNMVSVCRTWLSGLEGGVRT